MMHDVQINRLSVDAQLTKLAKLSHGEMLHPSFRRRAAIVAAVLIGGVAAEVYYLPTRDATAGDSADYRFFATLSTMSTNVILNIFFNILAVEDLARLRDPVTGELVIPYKILAFYILVSFISAFSMAFIDVDWDSQISIGIFVLQIFTYTAQHYTGVVEFMEMLRGLLKKAFTAACSRLWGTQDTYAHVVGLKYSTLAQLESGLFFLNKEFIDKPFYVNNFYSANCLNTEELMKRVLFEYHYSPEKLSGNLLVEFLYNVVFQPAGLISQVIANVGYYNSTINGFLTWFNLIAAWGLATSSITPFYILAFVVSWRSIEKINTFIVKTISALWRRAPSEILDEIPYSIRKTPVFSFLSGGSLVAMAVLSPFTALDLAIEALYGVNSKRANFDWIDPNKGYDDLLLGAVVAAVGFFNVFPAPFVQEWLSTKYCLLFGSQEEKRAIEILQVLKATIQRTERIPVRAFSNVYFLQQPPVIISGLSINSPPRRSENCCTRLTKWLCGLWGRGSDAAPELENGTQYYSLTSS